jgi:hypothetical protein
MRGGQLSRVIAREQVNILFTCLVLEELP